MATLKELTDNKEFMKGLVEAKTPEELGEVFKANKVELEEGITLEQAFELVKNQDNAELSEDELDEANGGIAFTLAVTTVGCFVAGGAALSFLGGYASRTFGRIWG